MTEEQIERCRELRSQNVPWKVVAIAVGVNVHTAIYHVVAKSNPSTMAARKRAWAKWRPNRRKGS